jgi:hypothetical protein
MATPCNRSISTRLALGFGSILILLIAVAAVGIQSRSVVMLDAIDGARSKEQSKRLDETLLRYLSQERELSALVQSGHTTAEEQKLLQEIADISRKLTHIVSTFRLSLTDPARVQQDGESLLLLTKPT